MHLSKKNASAVFEQLNRCLNDVKERMSTIKLKLNPDKIEFIIFGSSKNLTNVVALLAANALVSSRLDYSNSQFRSLPRSYLYEFHEYSDISFFAN